MPPTYDKKISTEEYQYVSYALLSLAGRMHLTTLCSKQSLGIHYAELKIIAVNYICNHGYLTKI